MTADKFAIIAAACVFAGGLLGLFLQHYLPKELTTGGPRDMIGAVVGLLTLLAALVLGLLIWTAYGVYSSQNAAIQMLAAKDLQLDVALADYGPEAKSARLQLREGLRKTVDEIWRADASNAAFAANNFSAALRSLHARQVELNKLHPSTDEQTRALATATSTVDALAQARLQMSFALAAPISIPLITTVLSWAVLMFCGFGLMSKGNPMSIAVAIVGALAVASAFHLIIDLSSPYSGTFRVSPAPIEQVLSLPVE
jgi:hypothetical protein